jgi:hypothetical protein
MMAAGGTRSTLMLSVLMLLLLSCYAQDTGAEKWNVPLVGAVYSIEIEYSEIRGDVGQVCPPFISSYLDSTSRSTSMFTAIEPHLSLSL